MNKKGWTSRDLFASLIIFGVVVFVFFTMIQYEASPSQYNNPNIVDPTILAHYGNISQHLDTIEKMTNQTNNPNGYTLIGGLGNMFQAVIGVVGLIFDTLKGIISQAYYLVEDLAWFIPPVILKFVIAGILGILGVIIVLLILNGTKWGNRI